MKTMKTMKKLILLTTFVFVALMLQAQKDVTRFLGIPVDGTKSEMIQKLKAKGYVYNPELEVLEGEFNGKDVRIYIATNNNRVWRIMVCDINTIDETQIRIRFNNLYWQFANNAKYIAIDDYTISQKEDISYEMTVHNKQYDAIFYQQPVISDTIAIATEIRKSLLGKYSEEELNNPTDEQMAEFTKASTEYIFNLMRKKVVWFTISQFYNEYYITIFYDNEYNKASGEDL